MSSSSAIEIAGSSSTIRIRGISSLLVDGWKNNAEGAAATQLAVKPHRAAMRFGDALHQCQANTDAANARLFGISAAHEFLKNPVAFSNGDSITVVLHADHHGIPRASRESADGSTWFGILA